MARYLVPPGAGLLKMFGPIDPATAAQVSSVVVVPFSTTTLPLGPMGAVTKGSKLTPQFGCRKFTPAPTCVPDPGSRRQTRIAAAGAALPVAWSCTWLQLE